MGHMQRTLQTLWELIYHENDEKTEAKLLDFSVYNKLGVEAAKKPDRKTNKYTLKKGKSGIAILQKKWYNGCITEMEKM